MPRTCRRIKKLHFFVPPTFSLSAIAQLAGGARGGRDWKSGGPRALPILLGIPLASNDTWDGLFLPQGRHIYGVYPHSRPEYTPN
eukprot:gene12349-8477_t